MEMKKKTKNLNKPNQDNLKPDMFITPHKNLTLKQRILMKRFSTTHKKQTESTLGSNRKIIETSCNSMNASNNKVIIEDFLNHLSHQSSGRSLKIDVDNSPENSHLDENFIIPTRRRKFSYQGEYSSNPKFENKLFSNHYHEKSKLNFKKVMEMRKKMGQFLRKNSMESGINVNMIIEYVNNSQSS
jgi:hypothetical protein